jgi:hypothetical protein
MTTQFNDGEYLQTQLQHWQVKAFDQMVRLVELESQLALTNQKLQIAEQNATEFHAALMAHERQLDAEAIEDGEVPTHQPEPVETPCGCE